MRAYFDTHHLAGLLLAATRHAAGGGLTGWQIALIGIGVPLAATVVTVLVRQIQATRRRVASPSS